MIRTSKEEALQGNETFEIWTYIFDFKSNRYHAENGRFLNKLSDQKLSITTRQ